MSSPAEIPVFINERAVSVPETATVIDAVARSDGGDAEAIRTQRAYVTDGVGRVIDPKSRLVAGAILRVIRSTPRVPPDSAPPSRS